MSQGIWKMSTVGNGSVVRWKSQAKGVWKTKTGEVVEVVPPGSSPGREFTSLHRGSGIGFPRDHRSYVVKVGRKYYWPRTAALAVVDTEPSWADLGALLKTGGMNDPAFLLGAVKGALDVAEQLRVQLAGCMVAAYDGRDVVAAKQGDYGWSPAYADVLRLRRECDELRAALAPFMRRWNDNENSDTYLYTAVNHYEYALTWKEAFKNIAELERVYFRK